MSDYGMTPCTCDPSQDGLGKNWERTHVVLFGVDQGWCRICTGFLRNPRAFVPYEQREFIAARTGAARAGR